MENQNLNRVLKEHHSKVCSKCHNCVLQTFEHCFSFKLCLKCKLSACFFCCDTADTQFFLNLKSTEIACKNCFLKLQKYCFDCFIRRPCPYNFSIISIGEPCLNHFRRINKKIESIEEARLVYANIRNKTFTEHGFSHSLLDYYTVCSECYEKNKKLSIESSTLQINYSASPIKCEVCDKALSRGENLEEQLVDTNTTNILEYPQFESIQIKLVE